MPASQHDSRLWAQVSDVFHRALERPDDERDTFVREECADPIVRAEVESLLGIHVRAAGFIEQPASELIGAGHAAPTEIPIPEEIGPYHILGLVGRGGMGVVYLAEDARLGRRVALKALAPRFVGDEARRALIRREARAAAALNHPGIATVYALEDIDDDLYIAGEYVPGETLRDELARGPLDVRRAVETVAVIARAAAAAHAQGIVHHDLKPENVMRTPAGTLKILDFGLAQFSSVLGANSASTPHGAILGTPAYMSPEQIRGAGVDVRSDVFALGVMLFEFLTGVNPFARSDPASTIAAILDAEPPSLAVFGLAVPAAARDRLDRTLAMCLAKSSDRRFPSAAELADALDNVRDAMTGATIARAVLPPALGRARWWWQFHQLVAAAIYSLLLIPVWFARDVSLPGRGALLFIPALVAVIVASALRLHLWFAARLEPTAPPNQQRQSRSWRFIGDAMFAAALLVEGLLALRVSTGWGSLLVGTAAGVIVSFAIIEPATTAAAFPTKVGNRP